MLKDELRVSLSPPRLSALRDVSRMVEAFGAANGLPESRVYMLNLALDELITNSVNYGFDGVAEPRIEITLWVSGRLLVLTLTDNGRRFDPTERADRTCRCRSRSVPPGAWDFISSERSPTA